MGARSISSCLAACLIVLLLAAPGQCDEASDAKHHVRRVPYVLEHERYAAELSAAKDDAQRREVLLKRWEAVKLAVQHCAAGQGRFAFSLTLEYWRRASYPYPPAVTIAHSLTKPLAEGENSPPTSKTAPQPRLMIIQGDCLAELTVPPGCTLHVYGDLNAPVHLKGISEVVIAGSVNSNGAIDGGSDPGLQLLRVFIGGDLQGRVSGGPQLWVHGNLSGEVEGGSTKVHVVGNFSGKLKPAETRRFGRPAVGQTTFAVAHLSVSGFARYEALETLAQSGYREFKASIGTSDCPPGIYTMSTDTRTSQEIVVHHQAAGRSDDSAERRNTPSVPYVLDNESYRSEIQAARDDVQRRSVLERRWQAVKQAVQYCDVVLGNSFRSRSFWIGGEPQDAVTIAGNLTKPLATPEKPPQAGRRSPTRFGLTIIQGDCLSDVSLAENECLHVYGDLNATVRAKGTNELIVAGSIKPGGAIEAEASSRVFVGGDLAGKVTSKGSPILWVHGNLTGELRTDFAAPSPTGGGGGGFFGGRDGGGRDGGSTASPSFLGRLHVVGDLSGTIKRVGARDSSATIAGVRGGSETLDMVIHGFASYAVLAAIAQEGYYSGVNASVARSDLPPGVYYGPVAPPVSQFPRPSSTGDCVLIIYRQAGKSAGLGGWDEQIRRYAAAEVRWYDTNADGALDAQELKVYPRLPKDSDGDSDGIVTVHESGRALLTSLQQQTSLSLHGTQVTDISLREVARLKQLTSLSLEGPVTAAGLRELAELKNLSLRGPQITDAALTGLAGLEELSALTLRDCPQVTDAGLKELANLKQLALLSVTCPEVTDAGLKEICSLTRLTDLSLVRTRATGAGLKEIANLVQLTSFYLSGDRVSDAALKELASAKQLSTLYLDRTQVTDVGLKELANLTQLTSLSLNGAQVTDAGLKELGSLNQLTSLNLDGTKVTDAGLKELASLNQLTSLRLHGTPVSGAGLKELAALTQLRGLDLSRTQVTDAALKDLAGLKQLKFLYLLGTQVSEAGVNELRAALPNCRISGPAARRNVQPTNNPTTGDAPP